MRNARTAAMIVALSVVVVACGTTGPTAGPNGSAVPPSQDAASPDVSGAPGPTPEPTPVDVAALTVATLANPALTATVALAGSTKLGSTMTTATTGTIDIDGRTSHLVRTDKVGKTTTTTETITGNGTRYLKVKGVWTKAGPSNDTELIAVLRAIPTLTDLGVEDKDGAQLHHLQATPVPAVPQEMALETKGITKVATTFDAWVTDAGIPVTMTFASTWKRAVGTKTVDGSRTTTLAFSNVGGGVRVTVPTDIWTFFTSTRYRYRIGYPEAWQAKAGAGRFADSFYGGAQYVYASRARQTNANLAFITKGILKSLKSITGYTNLKILSNSKAKLDGVTARRIEFRGTSSSGRVYGQAIYAIKGAAWYFLGFDAYTKQDDASRAMFTTFIRTFDFR